jgi:hypothetical protein
MIIVIIIIIMILDVIRALILFMTKVKFCRTSESLAKGQLEGKSKPARRSKAMILDVVALP